MGSWKEEFFIFMLRAKRSSKPQAARQVKRSFSAALGKQHEGIKLRMLQKDIFL